MFHRPQNMVADGWNPEDILNICENMLSIQPFQKFAEFMAFIWLMVFVGLVESVYSGPQIGMS